MVVVVLLQQDEYGRQIDLLVLVDGRLRAAFGHGLFCLPVLQVGCDELFPVSFFREAESIQRVYHRPGSDYIGQAGIDLGVLW